MSFLKRLRGKIEDYTFCYAKDGGQGFIHKDSCECGIGAENKCCQALKDHNKFQIRCEELLREGKTRSEIITIIKPEFKDSQWWKDNVIEYNE